MPVTILSPLDGDTVTSPVPVSTTYDITSGTTVLTASVGANADPSPPTVSGQGNAGASITVTVSAPTVVTVSASTNPDAGSDSQPNVTVLPSSGDPAVRFLSIDPNPTSTPPPGAKNKYKVKGKAKHQAAPVAAKVTCKAFQVSVTTKQWTEVDSQDDTPNNGDWQVTLSYVKQAGFAYVARAIAFDAAGNVLGKASKFNDK
jgi:hypothetical protein